MNIDLLMTDNGEAGLVSDKALPHKVAGVMFDARTGQVTLEFGDADPLELNVPVELETGEALRSLWSVHVGAIEKGVVVENREVPLLLLDDPFGGGNAGQFPAKPRTSVMAFEAFIKKCNRGQPVHRVNLADEASAGAIMGGMSAAVLQFAPHLARQRALEAGPQTPTYAPQAPGPKGPGGMGGGGGGGVMRRIQRGGGDPGASSGGRPPEDDDYA